MTRQIPHWPRVMRLPIAAAYAGVSETAFRDHIAPKLTEMHPTPGTKAWLKDDLDKWIDEKAGRVAASLENNPWHN